MSLRALNNDDGPRLGLIRYGETDDEDRFHWQFNNEGRDLAPEQKLLAAILEDAYYTAISPINYHNKHDVIRRYQLAKAEAREWIAAPDSDWPFSFCGCCEAIGLDPGWLRRQIEERY